MTSCAWHLVAIHSVTAITVPSAAWVLQCSWVTASDHVKGKVAGTSSGREV